MDARLFWQEEIRQFPHGCAAAALWVVRQEGREATAPVRVLFAWDTGTGDPAIRRERLPLSAVLKAMATNREQLHQRERDAALWIEPLVERQGHVRGCLALSFRAEEPWREGVFLWSQRLAARLGPVLDSLEAWGAAGVLGDAPGQMTLFPGGAPGPAAVRPQRPARACGGSRPLPLPRPLMVPGIPGCVGVSQDMRRLGELVQDVARSGANVLLRGESGTGKEVIARALHACSDRRQGPFIGQNCAALPETLFESELFGHRAGAFTGAAGDKKGLLAAAQAGTFFLDEIGDMPLALQIKLLRVMQERQIRRIGELHSRAVDIRFVAATHKDLGQEIAAGRFRLDLYYRLKVVSLEIPPLRHRPEDIPHLLSLFLKKNGKDIETIVITEEAIAALQAWRWPGNVRELENEVQRLAALYPQVTSIQVCHLSPEVQRGGGARIEAADLGMLRDLEQANRILEQYLIRKALAAAGGRKAAAARRLGLSRQGLYKKIQRYGMVDLIGAAEGAGASAEPAAAASAPERGSPSDPPG